MMVKSSKLVLYKILKSLIIYKINKYLKSVFTRYVIYIQFFFS